MITAKLTKGAQCSISPSAHIGYKEHGGEIILGNNVSIAHGCVIRTCTGKIVIGNSVTINYGCIMHGLGGITIGNNVMLSPYVQIYAQNHGIRKGVPIRSQPQTGKGIVIESDVWIGAGAVILDGVQIGKGAVIGANAVVTKNVPEYETWGGCPAKKIGWRT